MKPVVLGTLGEVMLGRQRAGASKPSRRCRHRPVKAGASPAPTRASGPQTRRRPDDARPRDRPCRQFRTRHSIPRTAPTARSRRSGSAARRRPICDDVDTRLIADPNAPAEVVAHAGAAARITLMQPPSSSCSGSRARPRPGGTADPTGSTALVSCSIGTTTPRSTWPRWRSTPASCAGSSPQALMSDVPASRVRSQIASGRAARGSTSPPRGDYSMTGTFRHVSSNGFSPSRFRDPSAIAVDHC